MTSSRSHPAVIAYDIRCNRRRRRFLRTLQDWRLDGQKSVVETRLNLQEAEELYLQLAADLDVETDRLALIWIQAGVDTRAAGCAPAQTRLRYRG